MINEQLDIERWRDHLARYQRVLIPDFLQAGMAEQLHQCMRSEVPWSTAIRGNEDRPAEPGSEADSQLLREAWEQARDGFHFVYDRYLIVKAMKAGGDPEFLMHRVLMFLNDPQFIEFTRFLTGNAQLKLVSAQATRYRVGQFLREHTDRKEDDGRRYAYVLNLSRDWEADWGGLLQFPDEDGRVAETFVPRWNSLSLFKVPTLHFVSQVMPWALQDRYAITGWWHAPR